MSKYCTIDEYVDRIGNSINVGDYVIYSTNYGSTPKTQIGEVLGIRVPEMYPNHAELNIRGAGNERSGWVKCHRWNGCLGPIHVGCMVDSFIFNKLGE